MPVSDVSRSPETRIQCIYDVTPRLRLERTDSLDRVFDYGRVRRHVEAAAQLLPRVGLWRTLPAGAFGAGDQNGVGEVEVMLLVTPRGDPLLVLDVTLAGEPTAQQVANFLAVTCFGRERITVAGQPVLAWLAAELEVPVPLAHGSNVHQCVFAGGALGDQLLAAARDGRPDGAMTTIVYRDRVHPDPGGQLGIQIPPGFSNSGETLLAHARGVSVLVGWSRPIQNVFGLAATVIVSALGVLRRARELAFNALELNQTTQLTSVSDARRLVSNLSGRLGDVELDLSFGVEAYVDSVLIPEELVDSFQASMRTVTDLDVGLANTSRMVDRLASVIRARASVLDAATQDEHERRNRVLNVILAVGSLIALPPSLLLAFFGVTSTDVDPTRSVLDISRYWAAYGLAWLPFATLLMTGFLLRRRIRRRSKLVHVEDHDSDPEPVAPNPVPSPRPSGPTHPGWSAERDDRDHAGGGVGAPGGW